MKTKFFKFSFFPILFMLTACGPLTFTEYPDVRGRHSGAAMNIYDGHIWSVGGSSNEVWRSTNAIDWSQVVGTLPLSPRGGGSLHIFNREMWLIGGWGSVYAVPEIYKSSDGVTWDLVPSPIDDGSNPTHSYVFEDKLYIVWRTRMFSTTNGVNWVPETHTFPASSIGVGVEEIVEFNGVLYAFLSAQRSPGSEFDPEIWKSENGTSWSMLPLPSSYISPRSGYTATVYNNYIWIIGGWNPMDGGTYYKEIWYSNTDLGTWLKHKVTTPQATSNHAALVFDNTLWLFGGTRDGFNTNPIYSMENR